LPPNYSLQEPHHYDDYEDNELEGGYGYKEEPPKPTKEDKVEDKAEK